MSEQGAGAAKALYGGTGYWGDGAGCWGGSRIARVAEFVSTCSGMYKVGA